MAKVYTIISGKGGVGKTTSAINLGTALNLLGEDVVIIDGNLTTPNIGIHLGAPIVPISINHVLNNQHKFEEAIYEHESGTKVMPASLSLKDTEKVNFKKLPDLIKKIKKITNYILIDSAAGLGEEARAAIQAGDEIILITNPEMAAVTDALKTIKLAEEKNKPIKGVILTRFKGEPPEMTVPNVRDMLEIPLIGIIPEDQSVKESQAFKNAVIYTHPKSRAAKNYVSTTKRILGEDLDLENPNKLGFFERLMKTFRFK